MIRGKGKLCCMRSACVGHTTRLEKTLNIYLIVLKLLMACDCGSFKSSNIINALNIPTLLIRVCKQARVKHIPNSVLLVCFVANISTRKTLRWSD